MKGKWDIPLGCGIPGIQDSRLKTCIDEDDIYAGFYVITFKGGRNQSGTLKRNKKQLLCHIANTDNFSDKTK